MLHSFLAAVCAPDAPTASSQAAHWLSALQSACGVSAAVELLLPPHTSEARALLECATPRSM
eukprot:3307903-Pleurochrysis_carterae.AAC.1